ncbi:MAG: hypothetical protein KGQ58_00420 [Proteobacteria bacterium]|nr:hypothetical protein [Pseudomonadota bacterium]
MFELLVVLSIIMVFIGFFAERIQSYQKVAELYSVQEIANELTSAIRLANLDRLASGKNPDKKWENSLNPLNLLHLPPGIDGGVWRGDGTPGCWYYDAFDHQVIYVYKYHGFFDNLLNRKKIVRFLIASHYNASGNDDLFIKLKPLPSEHLSGM